MFCEFPLGRPLGKPDDASFQRSVLDAAFATLRNSSGPVWAEFPESISDQADEQFACALPPRFNPEELPAIDEAMAIRSAYERTVAANSGRTNFGRVLNYESLAAGLHSLDQIAHHGVAWNEAGLPSDPVQFTIDLRAYYVEAAMSLADSTVGAARQPWAIENWFYQRTEAGKLLLAARASMKEAGAPQPVWFYMSSLDR